MAHGVSEVLGEGSSVVKMAPSKSAQQQPQQLHQQRQQGPHHRSVMGSRRIFPPAFKVKVLDSYRNDEDCKLNQRATARKFNIHRRQIQKWLQNEKTLRDSCPDSASTALASIPTPAASPPQEHQHHQNLHRQHQHHHHHHNEATPAATPALNLSLARLHGDDLAAQSQQQLPPPPPQSSNAAQALAAASAAHQQQPQQPDYRFRVSPTAAIALPAGYPDFKDGLPIRQPVPHHYPPTPNYPMLYQQIPTVAYHREHQTAPSSASSPTSSSSSLCSPSSASLSPQSHLHRYELQQPQPQQQHFSSTFEPKVEPASASSPLSSPLNSELIQSAQDIKTERASPEFILPDILPPERTHQQSVALKREYPDDLEDRETEEAEEEERLQRYNDRNPGHLESLPLSPDRSSAASSDSEMEQTSHGNAAADLARRRSFSLRFKLEVLDAFHGDKHVGGNQRATARKFDINRRQVQKWLSQESELRGVIEMCGSDSRQRLGPIQESSSGGGENNNNNNNNNGASAHAAVDLRTSSIVATTDLGQISPHGCDYRLGSTSPNQYCIDSSLTPPYSTPGCSLSCCQETTPYYCYSPGDLEYSLKRCSQSCCLPPAKKLCTEEARGGGGGGCPMKKERNEDLEEEIDLGVDEEPEQESPLCLVKPKREPVSSTVSSPPSKRDAILFKPYLDNPVSKPSLDESAIGGGGSSNNNCQDACNLNDQKPGRDLELELSFKMPANYQQPPPPHHSAYLDVPPVKSAFVRYPSSVHYS